MNCLDSSFVIDFLDPDGEHHAEAKEWMRRHADEPLVVPYICAFEVLRGAVRGDSYEKVESFLRNRSVDVPHSGLSNAVDAAGFDSRLHDDGSPLSARDTLVASHAWTKGYTLVTRDRDFEDAPVETEFYV
ncbi:PIN domain-containing protein [Haladaptatus sp. F3-133]|uniref:Ribonuclease VapC n=1 Tax=Halorutilus salinus TaxID=2487751 RepID=A0A9Q4GGX7_9EURY|nr:PIN domain-containing protein [Halorutilus salinus]MCX2818210.1 PIN domain-containing protein [Halorutilus salinus]